MKEPRNVQTHKQRSGIAFKDQCCLYLLITITFQQAYTLRYQYSRQNEPTALHQIETSLSNVSQVRTEKKLFLALLFSISYYCSQQHKSCFTTMNVFVRVGTSFSCIKVGLQVEIIFTVTLSLLDTHSVLSPIMFCPDFRQQMIQNR